MGLFRLRGYSRWRVGLSLGIPLVLGIVAVVFVLAPSPRRLAGTAAVAHRVPAPVKEAAQQVARSAQQAVAASPIGSLPTLPTTVPQPFNALLIGVDRYGEQVARSDSIMLVRVDPEDGQLAFLSVPRDLWVTIPGHGENRINAAFAYGDAAGGPAAGAALLRQTIEQELGVPTQHYLISDFKCFVQAVDRLGGVDVTVERVLTDEQDGRNVRFEPGRYHLNGKDALAYVRIRKVDSDFSRMRRQQQVLAAMLAEASSPGNAARLAQFAFEGCRGVESDLSIVDLAVLTLPAGWLLGANLEFRTVDESMTTPFTTVGGAQVLRPNWERIRPLVRETFGSAG